MRTCSLKTLNPETPPTAQHPIHHLDPAWYAILGAVLLVITVAPMEVEEVLHAVEFDMLLWVGREEPVLKIRS